MNATPPNKPTHIQAVPNAPAGMKNAAIAKPVTIMYLRPQKPFWIGARGSRDDFAPAIIMAINAKKHASAKHMR